ncbi:hypothetical protein Tco_0814466 [Tanacetum coccineum]
MPRGGCSSSVEILSARLLDCLHKRLLHGRGGDGFPSADRCSHTPATAYDCVIDGLSSIGVDLSWSHLGLEALADDRGVDTGSASGSGVRRNTIYSDISVSHRQECLRLSMETLDATIMCAES